MKGKIVIAIWMTLALVIFSASFAAGQAANTIVYQGRLTDADGDPIGTAVPVLFNIWTAASGGTSLYDTTAAITPDANGVFTIELGPLSTGTLSGSKRWLGINVDGDGEMSPRQVLTSSPAAHTALNVPAGSITNADLATSAVTGVKVSNSSLTDVDLLDEPGLAYKASLPANSFNDMVDDSTIPLDSVIINTPTSGYIYVIATVTFQVSHTSTIRDDIYFQVSPIRNTMDYSDYGVALISVPSSMPSGTYWMPSVVQRVFIAGAAGSYKYYAKARVNYGYNTSDDYFDLDLTAIFVPTAYGTVSNPTKSGGVATNIATTPGEAIE